MGVLWLLVDARWMVEVQCIDIGVIEYFSCSFLYCNIGYYCYDEGYMLIFDGTDWFVG